MLLIDTFPERAEQVAMKKTCEFECRGMAKLTALFAVFVQPRFQPKEQNPLFSIK